MDRDAHGTKITYNAMIVSREGKGTFMDQGDSRGTPDGLGTPVIRGYEVWWWEEAL